MKKILYLAALSFAAAVMLVGLSGCPQKPKEELGNFKVSKLSFGTFKVDLEKLDDIPDANVKVVDFTLEADAPISSVSVNYDGKSFSASGSGKIFIGRLEELPIDRKVIAAFTVNSQGKNPVSFSFPITFNPPSVSFSKIYVDTGKSNSSADLSLSDGSCIIVSENDTATLSIESQMDLESVSVSVNSGAAQDATKVSPNKFTFNLSGLTSKTNVTVSASAPFKKPASYAFQVIKGMLFVDITSIEVNEKEISIAKATSSEGIEISFKGENPVKMGMVPIKINTADTLTEGTLTSTTGGVLKDSFKKEDNKVSVQAACFSTADKADPVKAVNEVVITLKAANRVDTVLKFKLSDENKLPYGTQLNQGSFYGHDWKGYKMIMLYGYAGADEKQLMYGRVARPIFINQESKPFFIYSKGDDGNWTLQDTLRTSDNSVFVSKGVLGKVDTSKTEGAFDVLYCTVNEDEPVCAVKATTYYKFPSDSGVTHAGYFTLKDADWNPVQGIMGNADLSSNENREYLPDDIERLKKYYTEEGFETNVTKAQLANVDKFFFIYLDGEKFTSVSVKKSKSDDGSSWTEVSTKNLKEPRYLYWDMFDDVDSAANIKAFEVGKHYKYELTFNFADSTTKKFTIVYHVTA